MKYGVKIDGAPEEETEWFDSAEQAENFALEWAREIAEDADGEPDGKITIWGSEDNGECGWGACPQNEGGEYYPKIFEIKE